MDRPPRSTRPRVLVADDHPGVARGLSRLLSFDCEIVGVVHDGGEVADAVARLQPVVVVVDVNLPGVNGLDVCRQITRSHPHVRVIAMSATNDEAVAEAARQAGASVFFDKTSIGDELVLAIKKVWTETS